jgi:putative phosphotransacetylase
MVISSLRTYIWMEGLDKMANIRRIPVGISARHVHVSQEHLELLFGPGYELTPFKDLSQPGQYAAEEKVTLVGPKGILQNVRILGPSRKATQVEISRTDCFALGVNAPVRESGDIEGTPGIVIVGPYGPVKLEQGVIVAKRHIHFTPEIAEEFGVKDGEEIMVKTEGERPLIFDSVVVRVREDFDLDMHLDTDEANAAGLRQGDTVTVVDRATAEAIRKA